VEEAEKAVQARTLAALPALCEEMEAGGKLSDLQWQQVLDEAGAALSKLGYRATR
jgi:hypothetical protein